MKKSTTFIALCIWAHIFIRASFASEPIERIEIRHNSDTSQLHKKMITSDELADKAAVLSDVLSDLSGVQIRRSGGVGGNSNISIRGSSNQQVNVYIDGQLVNSAQTGGFDLDLIPLSLIESVELIQSQSSGTGLTPIGGELHIQTKRGDNNQTSITLAAGTFGFKEASARQSFNLSEHQLTASLNWLESENNYEYLVPQSFTNSQVAAMEPLKNNRFEKLSIFVSDVWQHKNAMSDVVFQHIDQFKQLPNYQNNSPENASQLEESNWRFALQQNRETRLKYLPNWQWRIGHFQQKENYLDRSTLSRYDTYQYDTKHQFIEASSPLIYNNWQITPSIKYDSQSFESFSQVNQQQIRCNGLNSCDVLAKQRQLQLGTMIKWQSTTSPWQVNYSTVWVDDSTSNETLHTDFNDKIFINDTHHSQQVNIGRHWRNHKISSQFSQGIRVPTMFERYGDRGLFKGNNDLQPEKSQSISINSQHIWNWPRIGKLKVEQSLFSQELENSIVAIFNSNGIGSYDNVSQVAISGWSLQTLQTFGLWSLSFNLDWLNSDTQSSIRSFHHKKQPGVYHQKYHLSLKWRLNRIWSLRADWSHERDLFFDRANKVSSNNGLSSNRTLTDLSLQYLGENFSGSLHFNNIFDQAFLDLTNRPAVGREIRLSITFKEF